MTDRATAAGEGARGFAAARLRRPARFGAAGAVALATLGGFFIGARCRVRSACNLAFAAARSLRACLAAFLVALAALRANLSVAFARRACPLAASAFKPALLAVAIRRLSFDRDLLAIGPQHRPGAK